MRARLAIGVALAFVVGAQAQPLVGAYGATRPLDAEARAIFKEATAGVRDVSFRPLSVAKQIVAGMNYRFLATARGKAAPSARVTIIIFKPLSGAPRITAMAPEK